ncbi:MAG: GtrA family protein [Chloroflexota bacterium]
MKLITDKRERERFIKFAIVGSIGFGVDFLTFNLFRSGVGFSAEFSSVLSFSAAVISNFLLNRFWTYPDSRSKPLLSQLMQFSAVNLVGLVIRTVIFSLITKPLIRLVEGLGLELPIGSGVIGENLALATVVIIVLFWNYFINRYWTYNDVE